jgi:tetratricopeptide (TPR) repeat protein
MPVALLILLVLPYVSASQARKPPAPAPAAAAQAADPIEEGRKALEAQNYDAAAECFRKAIAADAADYSAHFHLALALSLAEKYAEAIPEYRKTLELKPRLYQAELNLGMLLLRDKQPGEAALLLESAAGQKPAEFRPRFYLAEAFSAAGEPAKAEPHYRTALTIDPKSAASELGLARSLLKQSKLDEAREHFQKAGDLEPSSKDAILELAGLLESTKPDEAIAIYDQFPADKGAQERVAALLIRAKRFADAEPRLAKSVAADPNNYDLRMIYGRVLRDQRKLDPAVRQFFAAAQLKPDSREAWNDMAGMLILLENYPQALAALDRSHALGDESPANYYFHAIVFDKTRQYKPALDNYRKFLEISQGKFPDEEFKARQRARIVEKELSKR